MVMENQNMLKIGEVCSQSGVPIRTIRYYESLELIHTSTRTPGGFRLFSSEVLPRLAFIKRAQALGFSLEEIGQILAIRDRGELPCREVKTQIQARVEWIDQQIHQLQLLRNQLLALVDEAQIPERPHGDVICPIIQPPQTRGQ